MTDHTLERQDPYDREDIHQPTWQCIGHCWCLFTEDGQNDYESCLDFRDDGSCRGLVAFASVDGRGKAFPRCRKHFNDRLNRYQGSIEQYAHSDVIPSWFDPADAGEHWDTDY
ncbi:MAG: hypothetical protein GY906_10185 [bacterium]|nr:hypothetical protein [bacterium]